MTDPDPGSTLWERARLVAYEAETARGREPHQRALQRFNDVLAELDAWRVHLGDQERRQLHVRARLHELELLEARYGHITARGPA